jgi:malonyl-CoA O-methyltransferase
MRGSSYVNPSKRTIALVDDLFEESSILDPRIREDDDECLVLASILEIGCGTGFLSKLIVERFKEARVFISDLSMEMVTSCRSKGSATYLVCDGEALPFAKGFRPELVISNMSLHWFQNFEASLGKLFDITSGVLAFSIPVLGTFKAWELAHQKLGINNRMLQFYSLQRLEQILSGLKPKKLLIKTIQLSQPVSSGLAFLQQLKAIGASPNIKPEADSYSAAELKALCREVDKYWPEEIANYEIAICILER